MNQDPKESAPAPIGVVYDTPMARADAALSLAALYAASSRREARVNGVCITGSALDAAIFCDVVARFYTGTSRAPSSNAALPVGFDASARDARNPPMVGAALARTRPDGQPQYVRTIQRATDTAAPDALLRNAITFSEQAVVVLSAPATWLARSLSLAGTVDQYRQRVKRVVVVEAGELAGDLERDAPSAQALFKALPLPAVSVGSDVGRALAVPLERISAGLAWAPANPVADAVAAAGVSPVPLLDVAALHYALHPDSGFFAVSGERLAVDPARRDECVDALVRFATAKPAASPARGR
jgi:hypothetical protein